jgi:hypothetical protein
MEEDRTPVGRPDFKSGEGRLTCLVGSTPTLFRHFFSDNSAHRNKVDQLSNGLNDRMFSMLVTNRYGKSY